MAGEATTITRSALSPRPHNELPPMVTTTAQTTQRPSRPAPAGLSTKSTGESGRRPKISTPPRPRVRKQSSVRSAASSGGGSSQPHHVPVVEDSSNNNNNNSTSAAPPVKLPPQQQQERLTIEGMVAATPAEQQEQVLFEQRLCEDPFGIAVRKINHYGKSSLRYVKCIHISSLDMDRSVATSSIGSWGRHHHKTTTNRSTHNNNSNNSKAATIRALVWGKKKDVQIPLTRFVCVRKGKTTERTKRNHAAAPRLLSLLTDDPSHPSLDIEAPTRLDRDKFARAFSKFLQVPVVDCEDTRSVHSFVVERQTQTQQHYSTTLSAPGEMEGEPTTTTTRSNKGLPPPIPPSQRDSKSSNTKKENDAVVSLVPPDHTTDDQNSAVSSLTGHAYYDQELVEELHHALENLRAELAESRAEAARAVKVAEQAIQSAEHGSHASWQNTVTHKAAEAAALAQKRSAEAIKKQRLAEERLEAASRAAGFWRKQAEVAEKEAGTLQTRAAAAEVQRAAMEERLESERRLAESVVGQLKQQLYNDDTTAYPREDEQQLEALMERNRALELALSSSSSTKVDAAEAKVEESADNSSSGERRKKRGFGRKKKAGAESKPILSRTTSSSDTTVVDGLSAEQIQKLYTESLLLRQKFELLRKATSDELAKLPEDSRMWADYIAKAFESSKNEVTRLRSRLAVESASRRKLLHEVQDLRGSVRVYCRPTLASTSIISLPSQDTLVVHGDRLKDEQATTTSGPMSFEFDRVFEPDALQQDIYNEVEEVCLGVLDGYNISVLGFGQSGRGKTHTILGDYHVSKDGGKVEMRNPGLQFKALEQLFSIAQLRSDRYNDVFTLTIVEVHDERLCDLLAGTETGEGQGEVLVAENKPRRRRSADADETSSRQLKLEIRTDIHGDTVVQGLLSVEVESFEGFCAIWEECLAARLQRLVDLEVDPSTYESASHVIATIKVVSANIATGIGTVGRLEFVDLAGAALRPVGTASTSTTSASEEDSLFASGGATSSNDDFSFANRSLRTLTEVVAARTQFARSVPYRNSSLTHLLRDSLEADTKVLLIACVSSDPEDAQETISALRFASRMRRVNIGKATKHILSPP